jgi:acid phosphatase type 7
VFIRGFNFNGRFSLRCEVEIRTMRPVMIRSLLLLGFLIVPLASVRAQTDLIGLYLTWQRDPTTTMTVNWVNLYEHTPANVWHRIEGAEQWTSTTGTRHQADPSVLQVRQVELRGLQPDTMYEFHIGDKPLPDAKNAHLFRTMPATLNRPIRFVNGGDMMHTRAYLDTMNRQAGQLDPDFALLGGDFAYADGLRATRWIDFFQSWTALMRGKNGRLIPMVVAIGNHEVRGGYNGRIPQDAPYFYGFFALPEGRSYYALDFGGYLSVLALDSGHTQPVSGAQTDWLGKALEDRKGQQFIFPFYHWPVYGTAKAAKGKLPSDNARSVLMRTNWVTQFERHGVSAVFEHDHHTFKRTHPLRNNAIDEENGIVFLGDGAWGVNTRTVTEAWYLAVAESRRHLFHVTLRPTGAIEVEAVNDAGEVFDRVRLEKPRTRPEPPSSQSE